jgi:hypothetical protein
MSWVDPAAWFVFEAASNQTAVTAMRESSPASFANFEAV